jgi:hypothetical protein
MVSFNLRKHNKRIKHIKFGPFYLVAADKTKDGEPLFAFIDGNFYKVSEALPLAKSMGYNSIEMIYEAYNSLG